MANILELSNITKTFRGGVVAVDDISLDISEGEYLTMLGPSGCGKTTTLRMIGGFEYPDSGSILLDGKDVTDDPPFHRPVNMMFQDFALFPHMSAAENIAYGLKIAGVGRAEIEERVTSMLDMIELPGMAGRLPSQLSIGQRQRVALARALVNRPRILLLDEPMSALDAKLKETMQVELRHIHDRVGITFIMVTHDQTESMIMSDRIMVMRAGRTEQIGNPTELYDHPTTAYVAEFLGTSNMIPATVVRDGVGAVAKVGSLAIKVTDAGGAADGSTRSLFMRPEKIRLVADGSAPADGASTFTGTVRELFFSGGAVRLDLEVGADRNVMVHHQLDTGLAEAGLPAVGDTVTCSVRPDTLKLFDLDEVAAVEAEEAAA
ncbi:MAG: ABC transporter ATP-binding protein [Alphaproteobacteria bacterium]|nr:ABC transporter ATP-binding protein [Alphaproteobacteria bacterium]